MTTTIYSKLKAILFVFCLPQAFPPLKKTTLHIGREKIAEAITYKEGEPFVYVYQDSLQCYMDPELGDYDSDFIYHWHLIILANGDATIAQKLIDWLKGE